MYTTGILQLKILQLYSKNQWKIQKIIAVTTALAVNTELRTDLFYDTDHN